MAPAETTGPAQPTAARTAPPGFKFIKVKKPDGTIVTVKKKLSPEELEKEQQKAQSQVLADAPKAETKPVPTNAKKDAAQYKIITVRMPDGTLAKVKRPVDKTDASKTAAKPAGDAAATATPAKTDTSAAPQDKSASPAEPAAPEQPLTAEEKEALHEQALHHKQQRRARFKAALLFGLFGATDTVLPDLLDGDEIMSDTDFSDDEDYDEEHHDDDHHGADDLADEKESGASSNVAPAIAAGAATAAAGVAVAAMAGPPQQPPPAARQLAGNQPNGADEQAKGTAANGKAAYKVTVKDLKDLDEKAEKKEESQRTLERRWAAFSFYFLSSLSIILPVLFLVLGCFIMAMQDKSVDSSWGKMIDPIKIAITVWPIVFAAVTAQGFKTWAAYKVERGVKLMELEQLVGSNSFGAVMKQPFVLRRLDLLTLGIFTIWALSPIGSQALLRAYTLERGYVHDLVEVKYVPLLGHNMLLSPEEAAKSDEQLPLSEQWQVLTTYYMASFMPNGLKRENEATAYQQDLFNHPLPGVQRSEHNAFISLYGIPLALPNSAVQDAKLEEERLRSENGQANGDDKDKQKASAEASAPFENITFPITSSYFSLTCGDWSKKSRADLKGSMSFSLSDTMGLMMSGRVNSSDINSLRYATLLNHTDLLREVNWTNLYIPAKDDWQYGVIDCAISQNFFNAKVLCRIDAASGSYAFDCEVQALQLLSGNEVRPEWRTVLEDFSNAFVQGGSPYPVLQPQTPTERYAIYNLKIDSLTNGDEYDPINSGRDGFELYFGKLFNSFVTLAHCIRCVPVSSIDNIRRYEDGSVPSGMTNSSVGLYRSPETPGGKAERVYSPPSLIFKLDWRWVAVFLTSVIILLIVGIASVVLEGMLIAPDVLGYASTLARNSRYLHLPKTAAKPMSGPERARAIGGVKVMIQDVKPDKDVGKIALGLKHDRAEALKPGRLYR